MVFGGSIFNGFVQDDRVTVVTKDGMGKVSNVFGSWTRSYFDDNGKSGSYRPLTSMSLAVDGVLFGKNAWWFHLVNVGIYAFLCVVVFEVLGLVGFSKKESFGLAMVFAVIPIHSEAVVNVSGRGEVLSGLLVMMALWCGLKKKWWWMVTVYFLAMTAKESGLLWGVVLAGLVVKSGGEKENKLAVGIVMAVALVAYLVLRGAVLGQYMFANQATRVENPLRYVSAETRVVNGIANLGFGIYKTVWPKDLSYDYSYNQLEMVKNVLDRRLWVLGGFLVCLGWVTKKYKWGWLALVMVIIPWTLTGNVLMPIGTIFGERLWMLPSLGILLVIFGVVKKINKKILSILFGILLVLGGLRSWLRVGDWKSEEVLFVHDAKVAKNSVLAASNEAAMWIKIGDMKKADEAIKRGEAVGIKYNHLMNNRGLWYWNTGNLEKAREVLEKCDEEYGGYYFLCKENLEDLKRQMKK